MQRITKAGRKLSLARGAVAAGNKERAIFELHDLA